MESRATSALGCGLVDTWRRGGVQTVFPLAWQQNLPLKMLIRSYVGQCSLFWPIISSIWLVNQTLQQLHLCLPLPSPAILARGDLAILSCQDTFEADNASQFPQSRVAAASSRGLEALPRQSFTAWLIVSLTHQQSAQIEGRSELPRKQGYSLACLRSVCVRVVAP